nr:SDR family oxidoreductase [Neoroseomonas alba]
MLVTGAAGGIGAQIARLAVASGHRVIAADVNLPGVKRPAGEIGPGAVAMSLDITAADAWDRVLDAVWDRFGGLDILVNNAAIVHPGQALDVAIDCHQQTMGTNFMGALKGMMAVLPRFRAQGSGHLVTVCSMTAFLPSAGLASYAAAKHALRAFHHAVAIEERDSATAFTIIHPSATETPMLEQEAREEAAAMAFVRDPMDPAEVAGIVLKAIRARKLEVYVPANRGPTVRRQSAPAAGNGGDE